LAHLEEILSIMEEQSPYAKESKCEFGMKNILYLGHVVSAQGEDIDYIRLATTKNITHLHGFFEICSYYRWLVKWFSLLATPLTNLTKKGAFRWT